MTARKTKMDSIGFWRRPAASAAAGAAVGLGYCAPLATPAPFVMACAVLLGLMTFAGLHLLRSQARPRWPVAAASMLAALLIALSIPLTRDGFADVRITATGQKNPDSRSSEVFARLVSAPVQGLRALAGEGWESRGDTVVSYKTQPALLHHHGPWSTGAALRFVRHAYSGIAELSIDGRTQRLDLYSANEGFVDVPLPDASVSWKGYLQRACLMAGLTLLFAGAGMALMGASAAVGSAVVLALLAASAALWHVSAASYAGSLDIVAFEARGGIARVDLDAGHGFTPALSLPVEGGATVASDRVAPNPLGWKLRVEGGFLRVLHDLDAPALPQTSSDSDQGCRIAVGVACVYEVMGSEPPRIWLHDDAQGANAAIALPESTPHGQRLFLLVERQPGHIAVSASRARIELSEWENHSSHVVSMRLLDRHGQAARKLVRLRSDVGPGYRMAAPGPADGTFDIPALARPDTKSFVASKLSAAAVGGSFILLIATALGIARELARAYREGRRLPVLACVAGCGMVLGIAVAVGWPAVLGWDGFAPYQMKEAGVLNLWYGIGYPLVIGGFLLLGPGGIITAWSALATAVALLGAAAMLLRRDTAKACWLAPLLLCAVLPFTTVMVGTVTHLRDAMNGLMLTLFALAAFWAAVSWTSTPKVLRVSLFSALLCFGCVLALVRVDNIPTLVIVCAGMTFSTYRLQPRAVMAVVMASACWVGVNPLMERLIYPNREAAAREKRMYASTAIINPLTGMLALGKGRLPDELHAQAFKVLDQVMDADDAIKNWSPYHIRYWHATQESRGVPSQQVNQELRQLYLRVVAADPLLFMRLRLATFGAMLGYAWFEPERYGATEGGGRPTFHDHLLGNAPHWQKVSQLNGYPASAHRAPDQTQAMLDWEQRVACTWPQLLVCIVVAVGFRRHPLSGSVALGELARAGVFFLFAPASVFLYLYDMHLLGLLLPMLVLAESAHRRGWRPTGSAA